MVTVSTRPLPKRALLKRYEMDDSDTVWLCTHKLKEYGLDIEQWNKEVKT